MTNSVNKKASILNVNREEFNNNINILVNNVIQQERKEVEFKNKLIQLTAEKMTALQSQGELLIFFLNIAKQVKLYKNA